jgi:chromosome segregation protein
MMLTRQPGIVGFAWEMLDHDPRIETAVRYVLRDTLIVQDLSTARKNMGGVRMVTLQGGVTEAGGAMVGGSKVRLKVSFGGRIQGMNEVDKLDAEVIRLQILADKVCDQLSACRRKQQELKQRIDNTSEDDRSMRKREWKEDFRLSEQRLAKATGAVVAVGQKLEDIEKKCSQKEQQLLRAEEAMRVSALVREVASAALQEVSPLHLQQTLREVQETRVKAFEDQAISKGIIDGGAAKGEILLERVGELNSRCSRLEQENAERLKNIKLWQGENESVVVELTDAEANHSQMAEEHKELEDERLRLTEERATMHAGLTQKANHAATLIKRAEEFTLQLVQKKDGLNDLLDEMTAVGCEVAGDNLALPSVADAEANARKLDHRLNKIGDVNMLAIEQYDITDARLNELKRDNKTLQQRRKSLIDLTERLEKQRKARLLHVLKCVDENFRKVYEILSDGGRGELFLENPEDPFKAGLSMWCQPSGKSSKCKLSLLSGGEQSMAALSLIFAIQDYDPSPFYYFDEVDQNLDAFNAERIAKMCRKRSKQAQFIMVTLRKVSLQLADHHIGITHAGDGCSRRIANFDKERAIELGAAALKELENEKSLAKVREGSIIDSNGLPNVDNMPTTPEGLPLPSSLGGLAERAEELTDDIEEHQEVRRQVIEETTTVEITEQQKDDLDLEGLLED